MKPQRPGHHLDRPRVALTACLVFCSIAISISHAAETPQERAAAKIAWELGSWKSIDYHVVSKFRNYRTRSGRPQVFDTEDYQCVETALGQRMQRCDRLLGESLFSRGRAYFDGKRGADVVLGGPEFDTIRQIEVLRHFPRLGKTQHTNRPVPFRYYYLGPEPLNQALPRSRHLGEEVVIGRPCDAFVFTQDKPEMILELVEVLDRETGVPLEVRGYRTSEDLKASRPSYVWTARSVEMYQGHSVVNSSRLEQYSEEDSSVVYTSNFEVKSVEYDKHHAASEFFPVIPPGTTVMDAFAGKIVTWPGGDKKAKPSPARVEELTKKEQAIVPIRAVQPQNGITPSLVVGGISVALLAVGAVLWRRGA